MVPRPFIIYKMKKVLAKTLTTCNVVARCVQKCGNCFRYFHENDGKTYVNMECMRCGYKYHTQVDSFGDRYEEDNDGIIIKDPNLLFNRRKQS